MNRGIVLSLLITAAPAISHAATDTLSELLQRVQSERTLEQKANADRLVRFSNARDEQARLLSEAQQQLEVARVRGRQLEAQHQENARRLEEQAGILKNRLGDLDSLRDQVRQSATELREILETSLISAQIPKRRERLQQLIDLDELPAIEQLEELWQLQLEEMVETGRVVRFRGRIITGDGEQVQTLITRIGTFDAVADGRYLRYLPAAGQLVEPSRQPPARYQQMARELENASGGNHPMAIDPTGGSLLQQLARTPDLEERIRQGVDQGGLIGWIILTLGGTGLLIALVRTVALSRINRRIRQQFNEPEPDLDNPLGRILQVYTGSPGVDTETLGLKLDEAILKELPGIKWGLGTLAVLAAIAPLLGLLGTVTGIIETFQAVTLYGTGDPRIMSGGISQALVTTVQGLVVAIPLLLLHSFLSSRSNQIIQLLDEQSAALVARLAEKQFEKTRG